MKYRNSITGAILETKSTIIGGVWQAEESAISAVDEKKEVAPVQPKRKAVKKKDE